MEKEHYLDLHCQLSQINLNNNNNSRPDFYYNKISKSFIIYDNRYNFTTVTPVSVNKISIDFIKPTQ